MPAILVRLLESGWFAVLARVVLTFMFWGAGLGFLADFAGATAAVAGFGLQPAAAIAALSIATLLVGSGLVIANRAAWLGCGMLAAFTALTIPVAHAFWRMEGEAALVHFHFVTEHVTVIGAMMMTAAVLSRRARVRRSVAAPVLAPAE